MNDSPENYNFFKIILSSIADGVFSVNNDRVITSFNRAAEKITGIPSSQAVGKHCQDVFHSDICDNCLLKNTIETGIETIDRPVNIINNQGEKTEFSSLVQYVDIIPGANISGSSPGGVCPK